MGNVLEFYLKMKDMMSSGLVKVAATAKETFAKVQTTAAKATEAAASGFKKVQEAVKGVDNSANNYKKTLGSLYDKMNDLKRFRMDDALGTKQISKATIEVKKLQHEIDKLEGKKRGGSGAKGFGGLLGKAAGFIAPLAIAGSLMSFGKSSISAAMDFNAQKTSFGVLTGNRSKGNDLANDLRQLKQDTIMGPTVYKNAQTMLGFGIATDKVLPSLKMLGDVSMGNEDKLQRLTLAFSQVSAAGRLTGQDLLQFINAGFNPLGEISKKTGKSFAVLKEEMRKGGISFKMVEDAFISATSTGGRFNNMLNTMADTSAGKLKKLEGQWAAFKIDAGEAMLPVVGSLMEMGTKLMDVLNIHKTVPTVLATEQASIVMLVNKITSLNEGNKTRVDLIQKLKNSYPDLFGNLDTEKVKNEELLKTLDKINIAYGDKIKIASNALALDLNSKEQLKNYEYADKADMAISRLKVGDVATAKSIMTDANGGFFGNLLTNRDETYDWRHSPEANIKTLTAASKKYRAYGDSWSGGINDLKKEKQNLAGDKQVSENNELLQMADKWIGKNKKPFVRGAGMDPNLKLMNEVWAKSNKGLANEDDFNALRKMMGIKKVGAAAINPSSNLEDDGNKTKSAKSSTNAIGSSITGAGPRVINISGVKFCDTITLNNNGTVAQGDDMVEDKFTDMFLRILNSGASVSN